MAMYPYDLMRLTTQISQERYIFGPDAPSMLKLLDSLIKVPLLVRLAACFLSLLSFFLRSGFFLINFLHLDILLGRGRPGFRLGFRRC